MDFIYQELAKAGITVAVKELFTRVVAAWDNKNLNARKVIRDLAGTAYINYLEKHVARVVRLRTIHSADYDVLLNELYHPLRITSLLPGSATHTVNDDYYIENQHITNIIGIAGQGKSTILRKLFIEQVNNGEKVPFFIELRRVGDSGIVKALENILNQLGANPTEAAIEELLFSNRVSLMLDGFDEVSSQQKENILKEMISLNIKYALQIIVTSRPGTSVCNEPLITNYKVEKLKEKDILGIIEKLNSKNEAIDKEQLPKIKETIKNNQNLVSVMTSPILVTLFHVCYPYMDIIPNNTVEFYSNLFMTLYLRHDKVKNFDREKSASLSHNDAYDCFCALCFYSTYTNNHEFTDQSLTENTEKAMRLKGKHEGCNPESLALDFVNVTCLIQKEGYNKYIYIHKSIQEFHAADFIRNISSDKKNAFYRVMVDDAKQDEMRFSNVVSFLKEIDEIDCARYLTIPLCNHFGIPKWDGLNSGQYKDLFREFFFDTYLHLIHDGNGTDVVGFSIISAFNDWMYILDPNGYNDVYTSIVDILAEGSLSTIEPTKLIMAPDQNTSKLSVINAMTLTGLETVVYDVFISKTRQLYQNVYKSSIDKVNNESESIKEIFDLI